MKVAVVGLWHLGLVTAGCVAKAGHDVIAYDPSDEIIEKLKSGKPPIFEPGLEELLKQQSQLGKLIFTREKSALSQADIVWVTFDTPINHEDAADIESVTQQITILFQHLRPHALVIISSQLPVGTTQKLQAQCALTDKGKEISFAYLPENLRLGKAIDIFTCPDRIVIGLDNQNEKDKIKYLLKPFSDNLIWMSILSAEMTKHAINAFLALSVTFINELAVLCEAVGANGREVELGLKSEARIGPQAYLRPGDAIAGGTLMRDIHYLTQLGQRQARETPLISATIASNAYHKRWACRKVQDLLKNLAGKKIAMLGLTYKIDTDTLRRSTAIETCRWLHNKGAEIHAYDPVVKQLPEDLSSFIQIQLNANAALSGADVVIISTAWPEFLRLTADEILNNLKQPFVLDPSGFIAKNMAEDARIKYLSVGMPS